ncbi:MAG: hypothetical protein WC718_04350 [Phycisphaerales bacterium]|jgi:hypothetical protein
MARTNSNAELWKALSQFGQMTDKSTGPTTLRTTVAVASVVGAATCKMAAKTGASTAGGDYLRIGSPGVMEVVKTEGASTNMPLVSKLAYAHAAAEVVRELDRTILGDLSDDGVQLEVTADRTRIDAATRRHAYDHNINHTDYTVTVALENLSDQNVAASLGMADSVVHGAGTSSPLDPYVVDMTPATLNTQNPVHYWARGTLGNGNTVEIQFWDCKVDPTKTITFARGQDAPAQLVFNAQHFRWINPVT